MINEFEYFHGAAILKLLHAKEGLIGIGTYQTPSNASYVVNGRVSLYIKHSSKRMSPWRFSFAKSHQDEIRTLKLTYGEVFVLLVCNDDGIVALSFQELKLLLDDSHDASEWISVTRDRGREYALKGSDGKLIKKIAKNDFPNRIIKYLDFEN